MPAGAPDQLNGGDLSWPSQVQRAGIAAFGANAGELRLRDMATSSAPPGRGIAATAKVIAAARSASPIVTDAALGSRVGVILLRV
ncbi:hypothetical protein GCM10009105_08470 [Dokdonella soli]|uniref:Uncharacterized protein n=1 Tax=Dokdonella soli TaxID=529810 RepID=A0ABN1IDS7_9GAMM